MKKIKDYLLEKDSVKNTNDYRSYANNKLSLNLGMKKALTKYAIKNKFRVKDTLTI